MVNILNNTANVLNDVEKKSMDELTIETVKQSVEYIKNTLREQQITALVKIKGYKIGSKIQYTIKFMGFT
jgi:hypothetical protein